MNLARFFEHWRIVENPFRGEEARQDEVFLRLGELAGHAAPSPAPPASISASTVLPAGDEPGSLVVSGPAPAMPPAGSANGTRRSWISRTVHSDFEKIAGDFSRPGTAIVFGEKGSGKTAIRIQLAERVEEYNKAHPTDRCLLVAYDELNPVLDRFHERMAGSSSDKKREDGAGGVAQVFRKFRLVDHIDAILSIVTPRVVSELFRDPDGVPPIDLGAEPRRTARKLDSLVRHELLLLQALYDRPEHAESRTRRLRRLLRLSRPAWSVVWSLAAAWGWVVPAAFVVWALFGADASVREGKNPLVTWTAVGLAAAYALVLGKYLLMDRLKFLSLGHRVRKQIRVSLRGDRSYAHSLRELDLRVHEPGVLPTTDSDETRYAMMARLRRVLRGFGYASMVIVMDRMDEPTLMSGDPERMQGVVWPLLNNKFLQQPGMGIKMLLPIELRHALFRESAAFFQNARLDKQNLIERLSWSGAMLYDLCDARLAACRPTDAPPVKLIDLFAEDVTVGDIVDALEQMQQPRDAFKLMYQCFTEHCANVTEDQGQWRVPRHVLETVRKSQAERVRQLYRGVRPA
jgi:hypothetical protein